MKSDLSKWSLKSNQKPLKNESQKNTRFVNQTYALRVIGYDSLSLSSDLTFILFSPLLSGRNFGGLRFFVRAPNQVESLENVLESSFSVSKMLDISSYRRSIVLSVVL